MAATSEDISFDFDAGTIVGPVNQVVKAWGQMINVMGTKPKKADAVITGVSKGTSDMGKAGNAATSKLKKGFAALFIVIGLVAGAIKIVKSILLQIPEVGAAFRTAGKIIKRNLLSPLRSEVLPLLNKMLDWVRDNQAMFIRWGEHLATAFRIGVEVGKMFFSSMKVLFKSAGDAIRSFFGGSVQSVHDTIRVIMTKIAAMMIFIMILLEPAFKFIGKLIGVVAATVIGLIGGIIKGFALMSDKLRLGEEFQDLIKTLDDVLDELTPVLQALQFIGVVAGVLVGILVKLILVIIKLGFKMITLLLKPIFVLIKLFVNWAKQSKGMHRIWQGLASVFSTVASVIDSVISSIANLMDEIRGGGSGGKAIQAFVNKLKKWGRELASFFSKIINKIKGVGESITAVVKKLKIKIPTVTGAVEAAKKGVATAVGAASSLKSAILNKIEQTNIFNVKSTDTKAVVDEITKAQKNAAEQLSDDINQATEANGF